MTLQSGLEDGMLATVLDQRIVLRSVSWSQYVALLRSRGERARPRMTYQQGVLELMSPGSPHESTKTLIARLVEAYADEMGIDITGVGSWTLKNAAKKVGAEPDECYVMGTKIGKVPDFAIEVNYSSGGVDKLEVYRELGVPEVWIWSSGTIEVHTLRGSRYARIDRSRFLPDLDLRILASFAEHENQPGAVRAFRATLRSHQ